MSLQSGIAKFGGDLWSSWRSVAFWPWPAVVFGYPRSLMSWQDYRRIAQALEPGDIVLTRSAPFFGSNSAIPGAFKHAAVAVGRVTGKAEKMGNAHYIIRPTRSIDDSGCRAVVHAISEGVCAQDLGELLFHADYAIAVRPWKTKEQQDAIVNGALLHVGKEYDFEFNAKTDAALFCTELAAVCLHAASIAPPPMDKVATSIKAKLLPLERYKGLAYLADRFLQYDSVAASDACYEPGFASLSEWPGLLTLALNRTKVK